MKEASKTYQFEQAHACAIFTNERSRATGRKHAKLYVQAIDQYGYQREWTLAFVHEPGNSKLCSWESHIYMHPGRRCVVKVGAAQAQACIKRFLKLCSEYPSLLFNRTGEHTSNVARPCSEGFVHFAESLHRGALPSCSLL